MRKFSWCRRENAANCTLEPLHYHICITETLGRTLKPPCGKPYINLYFHDLDPEALRRNLHAKEHPEVIEIMVAECFQESDARKIAAFVRSTPENALIIVNCAAGVSRSPGAVLALRRVYGGDTEEVFQKAHPNIHVTSVLERVLREPS